MGHGDGGPGGPEGVVGQGAGGVVVLGGAANRGRGTGGGAVRGRMEGTRGRVLRPQGRGVHGGQFR